ncbi:MAG: 16S rRNA (guanine(966)-N(2))-methyltransferase RsmD [Lachnospiraceae bacterium]|nr:16S rRNA (guanine(966)-N(2))-methyltransferase RsmD [Lachnospiraceae bacterium]
MRVIAGTRKSIPLKSLPGLNTRPTTDRIKETLFNMIAMDIPDCRFLDLFAGSGQIAIEALSRGARHATLIENQKEANAIIKENIKKTKFEDMATLLERDVVSGLSTLVGQKFDVIFMDPPYEMEMENSALQALIDYDLIDDKSLIIVEEKLNCDFSFAEEMGYIIHKEKCYKTNKHVFLGRKQA